MTAQEIYDRDIKPLPTAERLKLAAMILNNIPSGAIVDESGEWSEEDLRDFTRSGWARIDAAAGGGDDDQAR